MLTLAAFLTASVLIGPPSTSIAATSAYLAPIEGDVLGKGFSAAEVETKLRARLGRGAGLRLVDEAEPGSMRLQVTGCTRAEATKVKREREPAPPVTLPAGHGPTVIREESHGVSIENQSFVVLSIRVVWQDETREIASGEWDHSLDAAVSTVAKELEKLAKRKKARPRP